MRSGWRPESPEVFSGPIPAEVFERVKGWSALVDPHERVERVAVATQPCLTLLVMTNTYFYIVRATALGQWCDGKPRSTLHASAEGNDLLVRQGPVDEQRFGALVPSGSAEQLAAELYRAFTIEDVERMQRTATSGGRPTLVVA